jgi:small-conductance mechanosensitive channel
MKEIGFLTALSFSLALQAGNFFDPLDLIKKQVDLSGSKKFHVAVGAQDKQQLLERLKEEKAELEGDDKQFEEYIKINLERVSHQISFLKERLKESHAGEFLNKKLSLLNETHQTLIDMQLSRKQLSIYVEQHIKILEEYFKDPEFRSNVLDVRSFYSFENLQGISQKIADQDDTIAHLEEQKNNLLADLENRKKSAELLNKQAKEKEREQKGLGSTEPRIIEDEYFDLKQRAELLDLTVKLFNFKQRLSDYKIQELKRFIALLETRVFIVKAQRKILEEQRTSVKEGLRVDESEVLLGRNELEKKNQQYLETKELFYYERKKLAAERELLREQLENLAKRLEITIGDLYDLDDIALEPITPKNYIVLGALLNTKEQILLLDKKIELIDAQIKLEETKFERDQIAVDIIESWHHITFRRFRSEESVNENLKKYQDPLKQADREVITFTEKRNTATNFLNIQNKIIENLKGRIKKLDADRNLFKNHWLEYLKAKELMIGAQARVSEQIEVNGKIIETYSTLIALRSTVIKQINAMINELQSIGLRPPYAISWEGIKNIANDLEMFGTELSTLGVSYLKGFTLPNLIKKIKGLRFATLAKLLMRLFMLILVYLFGKTLLPIVRNRFLMVQPEAGSGVYLLSKLAVCGLEFLQYYFKSLLIWTILYGAFRLDIVPEIFPRIVFYLGTVPFFLILGRRFLHYVARFNGNNGYIFISQALYERLFITFSILLYGTIVIFLFREAFMLTIYSKSEVPTILLALYSLMVRVILVSFIKKEDILDILPTKSSAWQWLHEQIEEHYYLVFACFVALIILSEPHIGYGNYLSYIIWGTIGTMLIVRGLMLIHVMVKRISPFLFFQIEGGSARERFVYAKMVYGLFVIAVFIFSILIAFMLGTRVWGYTITFTDISDALHTGLFTIYEGADKREVTALSLLHILAFMVSSFIAASMFNYFILRTFFDLLRFDPGVQYTVSTIMHYLIVIIVTLLGVQRVGLGNMVMLSLIVPILIGLGWVMKDYANDFISYFIILVQRPFKIGDFVRFDNSSVPLVMGVVRRITPRSVIVRVKNSVSVVVPNSKVVSSNIFNWNYSQSFIAFPDMLLTTPYSADPTEVKAIMIRVLDANMHVLKNPRPIVWLHDFGENGYIFLVRAFLSSDNVLNQFDIASDVRFAITKALRERNIDLAAPAKVVKMSDV